MRKLQGKRVMWIGDINNGQNNINHTMYRKLDLALKTYGLKQTIQGITRFSTHADNHIATTITLQFPYSTLVAPYIIIHDWMIYLQ